MWVTDRNEESDMKDGDTCVVGGVTFRALDHDHWTWDDEPGSNMCEGCEGDGNPALCDSLGECSPLHGSDIIWVKVE
jgi:L-ascorbate metabolism protein UlaG (beta-lactamase superfamily)